MLAELPGRGPGLLQRGPGLAVQQVRLGQQQAGLGQREVTALLLELAHRCSGRLPGLGQQPHRQQQLGPVRQELGHRDAVFPQPLFGLFEVVQRGRHITAQPTDPAQVLAHVPELQGQVVPDAQLLSLAQVVVGSGELLPVAVDDGPVEQQLFHPDRVPVAAQRGQRGVVIGQGLVDPAQQGQDRAPLGLGPGPGRSGQVGQGGLDLAQRGPALTTMV